jgi:hypothetical protein
MTIKYVNKMKNEKIMIGIFVLMAIQLVSATSINIDIKDNFNSGEELSLNYTFLSETAQEIEYLVIIECPNAPQALLNVTKLTLQPNIPITKKYIDISSISEKIEPQTCTAKVGIISPEEVLEEKTFRITTNPSFEVRTLTCEDESCLNKTKVFILSETIYFNFESEVQNPIIQATLFYPDDSTEKINLPYSIKADQVGKYKLQVSYSKENYKTINEEYSFGVIEKVANIHQGFLPIEKDKPETKEEKSSVFVFVILGILLLVIILVVLFKVKKKGSKI